MEDKNRFSFISTQGFAERLRRRRLGLGLRKQDLAAAGRVCGHTATDSRAAGNRALRFHLVQIEDLVIDENAQIDRLLDAVGQALKLRPGDLAQIGAADDRSCQRKQIRPYVVGLPHRILRQVPPFHQRGNMTKNRRGGQSELVYQLLERPFLFLIRKAFQNLQGAESSRYAP